MGRDFTGEPEWEAPSKGTPATYSTIAAANRAAEAAYRIKDSGQRQEFQSGMVRDTSEGKLDYLGIRFGPMFERWTSHVTAGRKKYPDPEPGVPNWTLAEGAEEQLRARQSAARHFEQWLAGKDDEDHAAAVYFNINLAEYVRARMVEQPSEAEMVAEDDLRYLKQRVRELTSELGKYRDPHTLARVDL